MPPRPAAPGVSASPSVTGPTEAELKKAAKDEADRFKERSKWAQEYWAASEKAFERQQAAEKSLADIREDAAEKEKREQKEVAREAEQLAADRASAYKVMAREMAKSDSALYQLELELLKNRRTEYQKLGLDKAKIDKWYAVQAEEILDRQAYAYGDFFDGIRLGLKDIAAETTSWAQVSHAAITTMAEESSDNISEMLFDAVKGDMRDFKDYWSGFWDSILKTATDKVSRMAVDVGTELVSKAGGALVKWAGSLFFHEGSLNVGEGLAGDEFFAVLQKGEMVIPRDLASQLRELWKMGAGSPIAAPAITAAEYGAWLGATEPGLTPGSYGMAYSSATGLVSATTSYSSLVAAAEAGQLGALSASEAAAGVSSGAAGAGASAWLGPAAVVALPLFVGISNVIGRRKRKKAYEEWFNSLPPEVQEALRTHATAAMAWSGAMSQLMGDLMWSTPLAQQHPAWMEQNQGRWRWDPIIPWEATGGSTFEQMIAFASSPLNWESYLGGTGPEGLPYTGLFQGHESEIVLNPRESQAYREGMNRGGGSDRPIELHVHVLDQEFVATIRREADVVRVNAARRNMGTQRIYN